MTDVSPKLLETLKNSFESNYKKSQIIANLKEKIDNGNATYDEVNSFAIEVGELLAKVLQENLSEAVLPDGRMYFNIAKAVVEPMMKNNYDIVSNVAVQVQTKLNTSSKIGIKAIKPSLNQDRIDGIINRISNEKHFDEIKWILDEPVVNFTQSIVDDTIKVNAEFQYGAGLTPKIIRTVAGNCCKWCKALAGKYSYPDVPQDVYRRHQRCRCAVTYHPGDGKVQNVHTKKWRNQTDYDKIELRKKVGVSKEFDTSKCKHNANGTLLVSRVVERSLPSDPQPLEVIDVITIKGSINRTIYDENGQRAIRIDTSDHGFPKHHPMGAHKHIISYDENGNHIEDGSPKVLSPKDRKENADIL